jgi:multidrug efflux pump subunit AcrA (membrane-fusion protein)
MNKEHLMKAFRAWLGSGRHRRRLLPALFLLAGVAAAWAVQRLQALDTRSQAQGGAWVTVQAQPLAQDIMAEGTLAPISAVSVAAPFEGRILRRWVQAGDRVSAGAPLLQLDGGAVLAELREAQVAQIRARQALAEVLGWSSSAEVTGARRQLTAARSQLETLQGRLAETRALFDKGIVARTDVESAQADLDNATQQWHGAQDGLASALHKGNAEQVHIARLEAELRGARVQLLQDRLARATLVAPQAGVVLAPAAEAAPQGPAPKEFEVGSFVSAGEVLMTLGDTSMFLVRAQLDEFDAVRVDPGLAVQVTLGTDDAVVLRGELQRVSAQARRDAAAGGGPPMFDIQVLVREVPPPMRQRLRLGLTAQLRMAAEPQAGAALSVPLAAVRMDDAGRAFVLRASPQGGPGTEVAIEPGPTRHDRVVVRQGLAAGDAVWVPQGPGGARPTEEAAQASEGRPGAALPFGLGAQP